MAVPRELDRPLNDLESASKGNQLILAGLPDPDLGKTIQEKKALVGFEILLATVTKSY